MDLSERIETKRREKGLTKAELARRSGLSLAQIRRLTKKPGKLGTTLDTCKRLAESLGEDPVWLAGWKE